MEESSFWTLERGFDDVTRIYPDVGGRVVHFSHKLMQMWRRFTFLRRERNENFAPGGGFSNAVATLSFHLFGGGVSLIIVLLRDRNVSDGS